VTGPDGRDDPSDRDRGTTAASDIGGDNDQINPAPVEGGRIMADQINNDKQAPGATEQAGIADEQTTLLPMLIIGLVLITIGYVFIMIFV
jgi:hypothetical protein